MPGDTNVTYSAGGKSTASLSVTGTTRMAGSSSITPSSRPEPPSQSPTGSSNNHTSLSIGAKAGIGVGVSLGVILICINVGLLLLLRRKRRTNSTGGEKSFEQKSSQPLMQPSPAELDTPRRVLELETHGGGQARPAADS